jgi:hypothetical protein
MRHWINIMSAVLLVVVGASSAEADDEFAGWPKSWTNAYLQFEEFIATQRENVATSDLKITPEGKILTKLPADLNLPTHTTAVFYRQGADVFEMKVGVNLFDEGRAHDFPPGTYAACLHTFGRPAGYQFVHPLTWFQIESAQADNNPALSVRTIEQPQPGPDFWPNDRLLSFWDFHVFPRVNPNEFYEDNRKVSPHVIMAVTKAGMIQREKIDDALEKLLQWRIYYNGRLVEKGPATGDLRHTPAQGVGTYAVFVGVEGPGGFMPVSNFLQFPLFPERDGRFVVTPSTTDGEGVPDFLVDCLTPDQMTALRTSDTWQEVRDAYNKATIYGMDAIGPVSDPKKQALISLWAAWAYNVNLAKGALVPEAGGSIRVVIEAK